MHKKDARGLHDLPQQLFYRIGAFFNNKPSLLSSA